jgi:precorrin isomerase
VIRHQCDDVSLAVEMDAVVQTIGHVSGGGAIEEAVEPVSDEISRFVAPMRHGQLIICDATRVST